MYLFNRRGALLLAVVVVLLACATTSFAQGTQFQVTASPRPVRGEGATETAGEIVLQATAAGNINAGGSSVIVTFSAPIGNADEINASLVTDVVTCTPAAICPNTATASGSQLTLRWTDNVTRTPALGNSLIISKIRVNASALGTVTVVTAGLSATSSLATQPITFTIPFTGIEVASVVKPSISVFSPIATPAAGVVLSGVQPLIPTKGMLTCDGTSAFNFSVAVLENFNSAFTSRDQERNFSRLPPALDPPTRGSRIRVTFRGVPAGVRITWLATVGTTATLFISNTLPDVRDQTTSGDDINFTVSFANAATSTDLANVETLVLNFRMEFTGAQPIPAGGLTGAIRTRTRLWEVGGSDIVRFGANEILQPVANVSDCVTNLLFPYVANVGGFDTGLVIANTSKDDGPFGTGFGATETSGPCTIYGYKAADGVVVGPFTTPTVAAGASYINLISGVSSLAALQGHLIVVCRFLNAHGFAFIFDGLGLPAPRVAEGYLAIVLDSPRPDVAPGGESKGH